MLVIFIVPPEHIGTPLKCGIIAEDWEVRSERAIAFERHSAPGPGLWVMIPECLVLDAAVVPKGDRMRVPTESHLEFLPRAEPHKKSKISRPSSFGNPSIWVVNSPLTYNALRFVTGWVRTIGCDAFG